jgi:hypothetical protein
MGDGDAGILGVMGTEAGVFESLAKGAGAVLVVTDGGFVCAGTIGAAPVAGEAV